jgi:hypothetical protein
MGIQVQANAFLAVEKKLAIVTFGWRLGHSWSEETAYVSPGRRSRFEDHFGHVSDWMAFLRFM